MQSSNTFSLYFELNNTTNTYPNPRYLSYPIHLSIARHHPISLNLCFCLRLLIQFCISLSFPLSLFLSLSLILSSVSKFSSRKWFLLVFPIFVVKKSGPYIIAGLLMAIGIAGPIALKALAAIAGKALIISKVALTIASIIALKKIFSSHADGRSFNEWFNMPQSILDDQTIDDTETNQNNDPYRFQHRAFRR